jgi:biopolymer transport protein ExbB/TolQ
MAKTMKTCEYCGRENGDDATNCRECGTTLSALFRNASTASAPPLLTGVLGILQAKLCSRLVIESGKTVLAYRKDGTSAEVSEVFSHTQLSEMLAQSIPGEHRVPFSIGQAVRFALNHDGVVVNFDVAQLDGVLRLTAEISADSPPPAAQALQTAELLPPRSAIPTDVPFALKWSERGIRFFSATVGILLGLGVSVAAYSLSSRTSLLGRMFNLDQVQALVPVSICCMFFWAVTLAVLRWWRLRRLENLSKTNLLVEIVRDLPNKHLPEISKDLETPAAQASPLFRRLGAVVRQWQIRPNLQDANLVLQQHMYTDEDTVRNAFSLLRTFVWALPVLGLIGTVIGISFAVGGFAEFLGGNVDDVATIKKSLVGVTGGLSFAFLITLQGLLTSLLVMLPVSALQAREEKLYSNIQQDITDLFLPAMQRAFPESALATDAREHQALRDTLKHIAESVINKVGEISLRLMAQVEQTQTRHHEQIGEWAQKLQSELETGATRLGQVVGRLGKDLETASTEFLTRLSLVRESWDQHTNALKQLIDDQTKANSQIHDDLLAATSSQTASAQSISQSISSLTETTKTALEVQAVLQGAMHQLADAKLDETITSLVRVLQTASQHTLTASEAVNGLTGSTERILGAQQALQDAMRQLTEAKLHETVHALIRTLQAVSQQVGSASEAVNGLTGSTERVLGAQQTLHEAMRQFSDAKLDQTLASLIQTLQVVSQQTLSASEAVAGLTSGTDRVLDAQHTLQDAMSQLHSMGLPQALKEFGEALRQVAKVLENFQEPVVFTPVPMKRVMQSQDQVTNVMPKAS